MPDPPEVLVQTLRVATVALTLIRPGCVQSNLQLIAAVEKDFQSEVESLLTDFRIQLYQSKNKHFRGFYEDMLLNLDKYVDVYQKYKSDRDEANFAVSAEEVDYAVVHRILKTSRGTSLSSARVTHSILSIS